MTPAEAAALLEISPDSTPEQIEARFLDLRTKLENKISSAPTPGLKDKYRRSLEEITTAFETLTLAADSSTLPVLKRAAPSATSGAAGLAGAAGVSANQSPPGVTTTAVHAAPASAKKKPNTNREFVIVALVAVALLGGGGWFVMKTRAESEEKARLAAEAKARAESVLAEQRTRFAEAKVAWESFPAEVQASERALSELKSDSRNTDKLSAPQRAELLAQFAARQDYHAWLVPYVQRHPVKTLLAKLDTLLSAKAADEGGKVATELAAALTAADKELAAQKLALLATGAPLKLLTEPEGCDFRIDDAWGRTITGRTPSAPEIPFGNAAVTIARSGWPDDTRTVLLRRGQPSEIKAAFQTGKLTVTSEPAGLDFTVRNPHGFSTAGKTPVTLDAPEGAATVTLARASWPEQTRPVTLSKDTPATATAEFVYGSVEVTSTPSGAEIYSGERLLGTTPRTFTEAFPGQLSLSFKLKGHRPAQVAGTVVARQKLSLAAKLEEYPKPEAGKAWTVPESELAMAWIAPGSFTMGSPAGEADRYSDENQVSVTLTKGYWLGATEVTQAQYEAVVGANPSNFKGANLPVEQVSWEDAMAYCRALTEREREAGRLPAGYRYTLPTEAQWEYACRAGTTDTYAGPALGALGWYDANSDHKTHPVASKRANAWGLYDMHGNVWERCVDWYGVKLPGGYDPSGPSTGSRRVYRGGSWDGSADYCRSADRCSDSPGDRGNGLGFRLALSSE